MLLLSLIELPSATGTIAMVGAYSNPWFAELLPIGLMLVGIIIAPLLIGFLIFAMLRAINFLVALMRSKDASHEAEMRNLDWWHRGM
jgi:hypothetical protein